MLDFSLMIFRFASFHAHSHWQFFTGVIPCRFHVGSSLLFSLGLTARTTRGKLYASGVHCSKGLTCEEQSQRFNTPPLTSSGASLQQQPATAIMWSLLYESQLSATREMTWASEGSILWPKQFFGSALGIILLVIRQLPFWHNLPLSQP